MSEDRLLYTVESAARLLSISRATCYRLIRAGELESVTVGERARRISAAALIDFVARLEASAAPRDSASMSEVPVEVAARRRIEPREV